MKISEKEIQNLLSEVVIRLMREAVAASEEEPPEIKMQGLRKDRPAPEDWKPVHLWDIDKDLPFETKPDLDLDLDLDLTKDLGLDLTKTVGPRLKDFPSFTDLAQTTPKEVPVSDEYSRPDMDSFHRSIGAGEETSDVEPPPDGPEYTSLGPHVDQPPDPNVPEGDPTEPDVPPEYIEQEGGPKPVYGYDAGWPDPRGRGGTLYGSKVGDIDVDKFRNMSTEEAVGELNRVDPLNARDMLWAMDTHWEWLRPTPEQEVDGRMVPVYDVAEKNKVAQQYLVDQGFLKDVDSVSGRSNVGGIWTADGIAAMADFNKWVSEIEPTYGDLYRAQLPPKPEYQPLEDTTGEKQTEPPPDPSQQLMVYGPGSEFWGYRRNPVQSDNLEQIAALSGELYDMGFEPPEEKEFAKNFPDLRGQKIGDIDVDSFLVMPMENAIKELERVTPRNALDMIKQSLGNPTAYRTQCQQWPEDGSSVGAQYCYPESADAGLVVAGDIETPRIIQQYLVNKGYLPELGESGRSSVDGDLGPDTTRAMRKFIQDVEGQPTVEEPEKLQENMEKPKSMMSWVDVKDNFSRYLK